MKKALGVTALLLASSLPVWAQGSNFEGYSIGANLEFDRGVVDSANSGSDSGSTTGVGLQIQYAWAFSDQFVLGVGGAALTDNRSAGKFSNGNSAYTRDRYSLDLMPGFAVSKDLLLYSKFSAVLGYAASSDGNTMTSVRGQGVGLGVRGSLDKNLFWQAGYDTYNFGESTFANGRRVSYQGNVLSLGVGYKF